MTSPLHQEFPAILRDIDRAHLELRQAAKAVFMDMKTVYADKNHPADYYKGEYCYPFYETGAYYFEGPNGNGGPGSKFCFMPKHIDADMRRFIEAMRNLDTAIRPMFSWNIRNGKDWEDEGNLVFGDVRGWCYQGHGVSTRKFHGHAALVGAIIRGVYKDAFLAELVELAREKGAPLNKNDFMSVQAFSR